MAFSERQQPGAIVIFGTVLMKALVILMGIVLGGWGAEYSIVVSKKVSIGTLNVQQIRELYLQKRRTIGDVKLIPVNVLGNEQMRTDFEQKVLGMDRNRLNAYWIKQHFQGVMPPVTQPSVDSVKAFVENVEGSMGYLPSSMVDGRFRVVYEF